MESPNQPVLSQAPIIVNNNLPETSKISNLLSNKKNIIIIVIIIAGCIFTAYKMNYLNFVFKKKNKNNEKIESNNLDTNEKSEPNNLNILDLDKDYYINDENNIPLKINLKEMITFHKYFIEQQMQQHMQQHMQQQMQPHMQQQMQQQMQPQMQQQMQPQMQPQQIQQIQQSQMIQQPQMQQMKQMQQSQQKKNKLKHSKKIEVSSSEENLSEQQLSNNDLEYLKHEIAELEKQNNNI